MSANEDGHQICTHVSAGVVHGINHLVCFPNLTRSISLLFSAEPGTEDIDQVLREIYILYTDCALKDPFYELEMPIRCELFTTAVDALIQKMERSSRLGIR